MPSVQAAVDDRGDPLLRAVVDDGIYQHRFAGAWIAKNQAESALMVMHLEHFEYLFLVIEKFGFRSGDKRVAADCKMRSYHMIIKVWLELWFRNLRLVWLTIVASEVDGLGFT